MSADLFTRAGEMAKALRKGWPGAEIGFEIYRLSAIEQAMDNEQLDQELLDGVAKPWQIPVAYLKDEYNNIVLFRCTAFEENFICNHPGGGFSYRPKENVQFRQLYYEEAPFWDITILY